MGYTPAQVKEAIDGLTARLGCGPSMSLQQEFDAGLHPTLLSYDKVEASQTHLPILTRYLVGATSYLHQPANYYNIFAACRCVNMVQILNGAIARLTTDDVKGLGARLERLKHAERRDEFDAIAFELITAGRYSEHEAVGEVELLEETRVGMTPDILVRFGKYEMFVECKKIDRTQNFTMAIRDAARNLINPALSWFRSRNIAVVADVNFHADPKLLESSKLREACEASLNEGTAIIAPEFTVRVTRLPKYLSEDYALYPSSKFFAERYGYRIRSEWMGIVNQLYGRCARRTDLPSELQGGASTWLDEVEWDAAARWKVSSDDIVAKYRRFAFGGLLRGLEQIERRGINSAVHVWLESDYYTGCRKSTFMDLFSRMAVEQRFSFGWLVINETLFDVSPKGTFDLIEHGHSIQGPTAITRKPLVATVFVPRDNIEGIGEFGVGVELPDVDL
jgi:hypothetical protein